MSGTAASTVRDRVVAKSPLDDGSARCAIVVAHHGTAQALRACLTSLRSTAARVPVVVCDTSAGPGVLSVTPQIVQQILPEAAFVPLPSDVAHGALVNAGFAHTESEYVLVLHSNAQLPDGTLRHLIGYLDEHPQVGAVAPQLVRPDGSKRASAFAFPRPAAIVCQHPSLRLALRGQRDGERFGGAARAAVQEADREPKEVDWVVAAALLVRRAAIEQVGPLDVAYLLSFADVDWCLRMWQLGWSVVLDPRVTCTLLGTRPSGRHAVSAMLASPLTPAQATSAVRFFRKHGIRPTRPVVAPVRPPKR